MITIRIRRSPSAIRSWALALCCGLFLLNANDLTAHQLTLAQDYTLATRLTLTYGDGSPFAYESYELYAKDADQPQQVGRTDAHGQIVFIPDRAGEWRIKTFSEHGHGIDRRFTIAETKAGRVSTGVGQHRWYVIVSGLGVLFGLFGLYQLFSRRRDNA
jgi:nickel transport protein